MKSTRSELPCSVAVPLRAMPDKRTPDSTTQQTCRPDTGSAEGVPASTRKTDRRNLHSAAGDVSPRIDLYACVRDRKIQNEFRQACESLGFIVNQLTARQLPDGDSLVILTDGAPGVQKRIAAELRSAGIVARLSLLGSGIGWDEDLLSVTRDIGSWPQELSALAFKLNNSVAVRFASSPDLDDLSDFNLLGESSSFIACKQRIRLCAQTDAPVLICGETGTGKELAAQALHYLGERRRGPLVPLNCGAVPEGLFENELFGHAKGAYTDARSRYGGLVEQADGGTLLLDEIDTLSPRSQVVLLRFLQDFSYRALGAKSSRKADIRLVSASNRDLGECVDLGRFRRDLLYRIDVLEVTMPPLRERIEDVELLSRQFVRNFEHKYGKRFRRIDTESLEILKQYDWPGNIRELEHQIHRAVVLAEGTTLRLSDDTPADDHAPAGADNDATSFNAAKAAAIAKFEKDYICSLLKATHGNITQAAARSGKERRALGKLIKKHHIDRQQYTDVAR